MVEEILLRDIADDKDPNPDWQYQASQTYSVLAQYGCPENAQFFTDMAVRKQTIAQGLEAAYGYERNAMTSIEYIY